MTGGPLIIKIGGAGVDAPEQGSALWQAVAQAHRTLSGEVILVHGGGRAVDAHLDRLSFKTERRDGIRITPPELVAEITAVLAGRVNKALVGAMQRQGVKSVGLCLGDGFSLHTAKADQYDFDPGQVGKIVSGDPELLRLLMESRFLPVVSSIGLDDEGRFLNVNADDAAAAIASILRARGLVLLTDVPGILDERRELIPQITPHQIKELIAGGVITGGMIPKAMAAAAAAHAAAAPAIIASWNNPDDLVRIARGESAGTRVLPA